MQELRTILDNLPINIAIYRYEENDFRVICFNKSALKTENLELDDVLDKKLSAVFPGIKRFGLFDVLLDVHKNGVEKELEINFYEDERISGWRKNLVNRLENGDIIVSYSDESLSLTKDKQIKSLSTIVENSMNEVYIFDAQTFKMSYMNESAHKNIGYTLKEIKTLSPYDLKPQYNKKQFMKLMKPLLKNEVEHLVFETLHQRKDGSVYDVEIRLHKMKLEDEEVFIVIAQDISQRNEERKALIDSESKFRSIVESSLVGIFMYNEKIVYANDLSCQLSGYSRDELHKLSLWELVRPELQEKTKELLESRIHGSGATVKYDNFGIVSKSGKEIIARASSSIINYKGKKTALVSFVDITDVVNIKKRVELLSQAVEQTDELVSIVDLNGIIKYANEALVAHTGYKKSELIGKHVKIFKSGHNSDEVYKKLWTTVLSGNIFREIIINTKKDKQNFYQEMTITPMRDEEGEINNFIVTAQDVTNRMELESKLKTLATRDTLTGIYNRHKINEEIDIEIANYKRYARAFALLMIDVDHFKKVNDTYGHDKGDYVLKEITEIISRSIRITDKFGRWGGEEFVVLLPEITKEGAIKIATKLKELIANHIFKDVGKQTVSIGVSEFHANDSKDELIKRADDALYEAKDGGRDCVRFN
ncbi:PAS domain S-box protein [Sulfurimonas aquatica]|uniref:PAS domain S-box protein n=1 Tax=Sulfurimonas aquatica TaxID=2672570 RepID=A0A975B296_9BACT|nr:sensor domain-containing diguanylate cyclase [Sulfurimonas aquatica]QSZ42780.1 PAS domain S-box protein [Sulfurimonas aquatica]